MMCLVRSAALILACACICTASACKREERRFSEIAAYANPATTVAQRKNPYEDNAWAINEGARWFQWFNCAGCHSQGGGGMGVALMDGAWRYGSSAPEIYQSIVQGRPNGMPSFAGKIPEQQVWQLVAYVRSLSGLQRMDTRPGRNDDISAHPPPAMLDRQKPTHEAEAPR
jgi:cytochrome c oxidase cbb3-type subunit 3